MKYCSQCGAQLNDSDEYCHLCGSPTRSNSSTKVNNDYSFQNNYAIIGFITAFFIPILGWIFGGLGIRKSYETKNGYKLSIWAIVIATITFIWNIIVMYNKYDGVFW